MRAKKKSVITVEEKPMIKPASFYGQNAKFFECRDADAALFGAAGTGKTMVAMWRLCWLAMTFPRTRWGIIRKTRSSQTESNLVTLENDVMGADSPILMKRPMMRKTRDSYDFPNGSCIMPFGLDQHEKLFSSQVNGYHIVEATELSEDDFQSLKRALRNPFSGSAKINGLPITPFTQITMDLNPTYEHHWINRRIKEGALTAFRSRHEDNPYLYDQIKKCWTESGVDYLQRHLGPLTGFMRKRLLEGIWATAEGLVYDEFDPAVHILPADFHIPKDWPRYWAIDWGYVDPLVLQFFAKDGDGRLYLYREFYKSGMLVEDVAKWCELELIHGREPRPKTVVCDHDPENKGTFEKHCSVSLELAEKNRTINPQTVKARLRIQPDGRPRLFVLKGSLCHAPDTKLKDKPHHWAQEVVSYQWDPKKPDEPMDGNDHSMNATEYMCRHLHDFGDRVYFM